MAVNTSEKIIITDNAVEKIEVIPSKDCIAIFTRYKDDPSKADTIQIFNPIEARDIMVSFRDWLYERFK